jgi:hypothetical protein
VVPQGRSTWLASTAHLVTRCVSGRLNKGAELRRLCGARAHRNPSSQRRRRALLAHIETALDFEQPIDAVISASSVDRQAWRSPPAIPWRRVLSARLGTSLPGTGSRHGGGQRAPTRDQTKLEREGTAFSLTGSKLWCTLAFERRTSLSEGEHAERRC